MRTFLGKLEFAIEREVVVRAPRATVFRYFTDTQRFARWWGEGSSIDGRVGGALVIAYPGGTRATGEVLELVPPERVVFTYGYEGEGKLVAPGGSRVTIRLADDPQGTRLSFLHELADGSARDQHVQGWRYQLAVFATVVADEVHGRAGELAERWFGAWNEGDEAARRAAFAAIADPRVEFRDAYSSTRGLDDLVAHVTGAKRHMPPIRIERAGDARQCQGTALVPWVARMPDGAEMARGTNVFELGPDGRVTRVVGFWG